MIFNIPFIAVAALVLIGLYAVIFKRNLIKMVIGITLIESGVNPVSYTHLTLPTICSV